MKDKQKGGERKGAGRKPAADPKLPITIFVETSVIDAHGGKDCIRVLCYDAIEASNVHFPHIQSEPVFPKPTKRPKPKEPIDPDEPVAIRRKAKEDAFDAAPAPKSINDEFPKMAPIKPKTLDELRALCPAEITDKIERGNWLGKERQKYGI